MTSLFAVTYTSSVSQHFGYPEIDLMLERARPRNAEAGVTGALIHNGGNIMQCIEGPHEQVMGIYQSIKIDNRHHNLYELMAKPIESRAFSEWSLAYADPGRWAFNGVKSTAWLFPQDGSKSLEKPSHHLILLRQFWDSAGSKTSFSINPAFGQTRH